MLKNGKNYIYRIWYCKVFGILIIGFIFEVCNFVDYMRCLRKENYESLFWCVIVKFMV